MKDASRRRLERGLAEGESTLRTEQRKYEATGKYDPAGYAEAYGFLAAAVRHVLSEETEGATAERDDLVARLLTNDAGMAELVKRFDVAITERDDARGQRDAAGDEIVRLMKERAELNETVAFLDSHQSNMALLCQQYLDERDAAVAKLKELENA